MKRTLLVCWCIALPVILVGCASAPIALSPVGPGPSSRPAVAQRETKGYLEVFSAREKSTEFGFNTYFYPHSGYDINDASGKSVRFVPNHLSDMDESPDRVALPAGTYNIVARSTWCGQVTVPVVIENGNITAVHLDNEWWAPSHTPSNELTYLPNKEAVGWSVQP